MKGVYHQAERYVDWDEAERRAQEEQESRLHTAAPVIIKANQPKQNTVEFDPALKTAHLQDDGTVKWVQIPTISSAPLLQLGGGGMHITIPVKQGDEGLAIFAERSIDAWWAKGGIQNQDQSRTHNITDAFIIPGFASQPKKLANVNETSMQMRTTDGKTNFEFDPTNKGKMTLTSPDNPTTIQGKAFDTKVETSTQKATDNIKLDTPTTTATGNMNVVKKLTAGQGLQVAGGATISGGLQVAGGITGAGGGPIDLGYVKLAGDTMTGPLYITGLNPTRSATAAGFGPTYWAFPQTAADDAAANTISSRIYDPNALGIVGAGTSPARKVMLWDDLTVTRNLGVSGGAAITGTLVVTGATTLNGGLNVASGGISVGGNPITGLYLPLSGGSLTGPLYVAGYIQSAGTGAILVFSDRTGGANWGWYSTSNVARLNNASTGDKFWVDSSGNGSFTGAGTFGGVIQATGYQTRPGLAGPGTANYFNIEYIGGGMRLWIDSTNFGYIALQSWVGGGFLPLTGGTLSGTLTVNAAINTASAAGCLGLSDRLGGGYAGWVFYAHAGLIRLYNGNDRWNVDAAGSMWTASNITFSGAYLYGAGATGTVNSTGGPFIYFDANWIIAHPGAGNTGFLVQNSAGANLHILYTNGTPSVIAGQLLVNGAVSTVGEGLTVARTPVVTPGAYWETATLSLEDARPQAQGVGGGVIFLGKYDAAGNWATLAGIGGRKTIGTAGDFSGNLVLFARNGGTQPQINLFCGDGSIGGGQVIRFMAADYGPDTVAATFSPTRLRFRQTAGDEGSCGAIGYRDFDGTALSIVGAGTTGSNRIVRIYDQLKVGSFLVDASNGSLYWGGVAAGTNGPRMAADNTNFAWILGTGNGTFAWWNTSGTQLMSLVGGNGQLNVYYNLNCSGGISTSGNIYTTGVIQGGALRAVGGSCGVVFQDRGGSPDWQWYATGGVAYLYNGANRLAVYSGGNIGTSGQYIYLNNQASAGPFYYGDGTNTVTRYASATGAFYVQDNTGATAFSAGYYGADVVLGHVVCRSNGNSGQFHMAPNAQGTGYGSFFRNDSTTTYLLITNVNDALGQWNNLRPFSVDNASGNVSMSHLLTVYGGIQMRNSTSNVGYLGYYNGDASKNFALYNDSNTHFQSWNCDLYFNWSSGRSTHFNCQVDANHNQIKNGVEGQGYGTAAMVGGGTGQCGYFTYYHPNGTRMMYFGFLTGYPSLTIEVGGQFRILGGNIEIDAGALYSRGTGAGLFTAHRDSTTQVGGLYIQTQLRLYVAGADKIYVDTNCNLYPATISAATCGTNAWWDVRANNFSNTSDPRLKRDIEPAPPALDRVRAIPAVTFRWRDTADTERRQHGWLSTDVRKAMGDDWAGIIKDEFHGMDGIALNQLTAVLWRAVQELADEVADLKAERARGGDNGRLQ